MMMMMMMINLCRQRGVSGISSSFIQFIHAIPSNYIQSQHGADLSKFLMVSKIWLINFKSQRENFT